jgi:hypothetical protein
MDLPVLDLQDGSSIRLTLGFPSNRVGPASQNCRGTGGLAGSGFTDDMDGSQVE